MFSRKEWLSLGASALVLSLAMWLSTGTMAVYATSTAAPFFTQDCAYPVNIDHPHFVAPFLMLEGAPTEYYGFSVVLRRILYPLLAYPFMKTFDFHTGGLVLNWLLLMATLFGWVFFVKKEFGSRAAVFGAWLLATYPGSIYWTGLPYSYAMIVPCTIGCFIVLWRLLKQPESRWWPLLSLVMGILFLGYDLLAYFAPALLLGLALQKNWKRLPFVAVLIFGPTAVSNWILSHHMGVPLVNSNSGVYLTILNSYLDLNLDHRWWDYVWSSPWLLIKLLFYSNFYFLTAIWLGGLILVRTKRTQLSLAERLLFLTALALFLGMNWAPHYEGWQMRGEWIARLYQPLFVVMMLALVRRTEFLFPTHKPWTRGASLIIVIGMVANASITFGGILKNPVSSWAYYHFYEHSKPETFSENLEKFGRRPYGICK